MYKIWRQNGGEFLQDGEAKSPTIIYNETAPGDPQERGDHILLWKFAEYSQVDVYPYRWEMTSRQIDLRMTTPQTLEFSETVGGL